MNISFEYVTTLEYRLKAALAQVRAFESGEKYVKMEEKFQAELRKKEKIIREQTAELTRAHNKNVALRNQWFEVFEDMEKEHAKELKKLKREKEQLEKRALEAERKLGEAQDKMKKQRQDMYELAAKLDDEKGKNLKLKAQLNRDYENSSIPSSKTIYPKKISNNREKSGRKPGGQPGHKGHGRKKQTPTIEPILLSPPQEVLEDSDFRKTSKVIVKQLINIRTILEVTEYHAEVYYNSKTGERVHATFPKGVINDVNYGGSIKAFLFLLNNDCCTSIDKARKFLSDLTGGKLCISKGMINRLGKEFAQKTEQEQRALFADMLCSPVMHTDCTNAKENGNNAYVYVCATPDGNVLYFAKQKKGHDGVKGTPVEDYQGILVHDHEKTFYNYGSEHQECLAHVLRYLKDSMSNEPDLEWNREMYALLREMVHYRNSLVPGIEPDAGMVEKYEERYDEVLRKAKKEYEYIPPSDYYRDGYNLYRRLEEYKENHLLFLHDPRVPATNNEAERLLRNYKRKQQQAVTFRSFDTISQLCQCMSMLVLMRRNEENNLFDRVSQIFG